MIFTKNDFLILFWLYLNMCIEHKLNNEQNDLIKN